MQPQVTSGFDVHETFRILVPGYYTVTLFVLWLAIVFPGAYENMFSESRSYLGLAVYILSGLVVGLCIYAIDIPKKKWWPGSFFNPQSSQYSLLPSVFLRDLLLAWHSQGLLKEVPDEQDVLSLYFTIYDHWFPPEVRNKADFFLSVWHTSVHLIYLSAIFVLLNAATAIWFFVRDGLFLGNHHLSLWTCLALLIVIACLRSGKMKEQVARQFRNQHKALELYKGTIIGILNGDIEFEPASIRRRSPNRPGETHT